MKTNIRVEIRLDRIPFEDDEVSTTETIVFEEAQITELRYANFLKKINEKLSQIKIIDDYVGG